MQCTFTPAFCSASLPEHLLGICRVWVCSSSGGPKGWGQPVKYRQFHGLAYPPSDVPAFHPQLSALPGTNLELKWVHGYVTYRIVVVSFLFQPIMNECNRLDFTIGLEFLTENHA